MGKGGASGNQVRGYKYFFSILMGLCRGPIDQLVAIRVGDVEAWPKIGSYPNAAVDYVEQLFEPGDAFVDGDFADLSGAAVVDNQRFGINQPELFGGDTAEGGIVGNLLMLMGGTTQVVPDDVKASIADGDVAGHEYTYDNAGVGHDTDEGGGTAMPSNLIPDMRGVANLWFKGAVCSNNPYPKVWKMRVRRLFQGWMFAGVDENGDTATVGTCWYPAKVMIPQQAGLVRSMNPAHIIYQVLTDPVQGRGLDPAEISDRDFVYAANRLYDEGLGLCLKWSKGSMDIDQFIQQVMDHISGAIYVDRGTGLITLRLFRDDYDPHALPQFTYDNGLLKVVSIDTASGSVLTNEVIVKYQDQVLDQERSCRVHNLASIQSTGSINSTTKSYYGVADSELARRMALRDLKLLSCDLKKLKVTMDRRAWKMQPGSVFVLSAPDKGITSLIVRVTGYDDGTMVNGTITLECIQDVFGMPSTLFTSEPNPEWRGGAAPTAVPVQYQIAYEASYYDMQRGLTAAQRSEVTADEGGVVLVAGRPTANTIAATVISSAEGQPAQAGTTGTFAPVGVLAADVGFYTTTFLLSRGTDLNLVQPGGSAVIENEVVKVISIDTTSGTVTVARGAADTIPATHAAGTPIFFNDAVLSTHSDVYSTGETVSVQIAPRTQTSSVSADQATTSTVTLTGRAAMPYPPANVMLNGKLALTTTGFFVAHDANFTWASRNKVLQADQLLGTTEASVTPEPGTTYTMQIWDAVNNTMVRQVTGITDTQYSILDTDLHGLIDGYRLDFVLFTVLGSVESVHYHIPVVLVDLSATGYGFVYGYSYGQAAA